MTHIICRAMNCLFWEAGVCTSEEIEYEPDTGCLTFQDLGDLEASEDEEDDLDWESDDDLFEEEDEEDWEDEEVDWEGDDL